MTILITNPNYDDTTGYLYYYTNKLIKLIDEKGIKLLNLKKPKLRKRNLENYILKNNPLLLLLNGHGNKTTIYGDKINGTEEAIIKEGKNSNLLNNRLIYARSCLAAASLGKNCVKKGGCFVGYEVPFQFWVDEKMTIPAKDKTAELFLNPSNLLAESLIKGNSAIEAVSKFEESSRKNIMNLLKNKKEPGSMSLIMTLWNNMEGQKILGDKEMKYFS
jgi:hypothetical protein